jgi:hypothetical protein
MQSACSDNTTRLAVVGMSPPLHAPRVITSYRSSFMVAYLSDTCSTQMPPLESTRFTFLFPIKTTYVPMVRFRFGNRPRSQHNLVRRCKQTAHTHAEQSTPASATDRKVCSRRGREDVNRARTLPVRAGYHRFCSRSRPAPSAFSDRDPAAIRMCVSSGPQNHVRRGDAPTGSCASRKFTGPVPPPPINGEPPPASPASHLHRHFYTHQSSVITTESD